MKFIKGESFKVVEHMMNMEEVDQESLYPALIHPPDGLRMTFHEHTYTYLHSETGRY